MILVLLGAPGAGKGTQGDRIAARYHIPKISTGDIFRQLASDGTMVGKAAMEYMARGELVPDDIVIALVQQRITKPDCADGFLLDGFPRTDYQAVTLECILNDMDRVFDGAINFKVSEEELIKRLSGRRTCPECKATYHVVTAPPKQEGVCDHCGAKLIQRADDNPESIKMRLQEYAAKTAPLIHFYEDRGQLHDIDANDDPDSIFERVVEVVERLRGLDG